MYRFNLFIKITASKHAIGIPLEGHYTSSLSANLKDCFTMHLSMNEELSLAPVPGLTGCHVDSLYEKGSSNINEDRLLVGKSLFGVFDGATSLKENSLTEEGMTGGAFAAQIAKDTFSGAVRNLFDTAVEANRRIGLNQVAAGVNVNERETLWSTTMAVVRILGGELEYCFTGDALIMLFYEDDSYTFLTPDVDIDRETLILWKKLNSSAKSEKKSVYTALNKQIRKVRLQMNREYGVLNGEPAAVDFIGHGTCDLTGVTDILLFTDGLYLPKEDPTQMSDWTTFVDLYQKQGLQGVRDHVRSLQHSDPDLTVYPRFKLHDDIAAISLGLK